MLTVVTGGARSGKSGFAEQLVMHEHRAAIYTATGQAYDDEMRQRIDLHRRSREAGGFPWRTIEEPHDLAALIRRLAAMEGGGSQGEGVPGECGAWIGESNAGSKGGPSEDGTIGGSDEGLSDKVDTSDSDSGLDSSKASLSDGSMGSRAPGVLVDCLTLWLSNRLLQLEHEPERDALLAAEIEALVEAATAFPGRLTLVTNEVGSGIVPEYKLGRDYRDWAGRLNRLMAERAERVFLVTAGIPVELKSIQYRFAAPANGGG
jgi:adenosylcobinamide kinase/adenosylcobinamide-phosphate guanylyltransferase